MFNKGNSMVFAATSAPVAKDSLVEEVMNVYGATLLRIDALEQECNELKKNRNVSQNASVLLERIGRMESHIELEGAKKRYLEERVEELQEIVDDYEKKHEEVLAILDPDNHG